MKESLALTLKACAASQGHSLRCSSVRASVECGLEWAQPVIDGCVDII